MTRAPNTSGGAAAAGGFDFQAALGAIAYIHALRGKPVPWTDSWTASHATAVSFETAGPGDDISLTLADGSTVEVQAKKGLRASPRFWSALDSLCEGIKSERCDYGILAVCPQSSLPVRKHFALAFRRLGDQRSDAPSPQQTKLEDYLSAKGYDVANVCSRIRIKTVSALIDDASAVEVAHSELEHVCVHTHQIGAAWNALHRDAMCAISTRGRRTLADLILVLRAARIDLSGPSNDSPVAICTSILERTKSRTEHFEILGMPAPLPTDRAWLPLKAFVRGTFSEADTSAEEALAAYHATGEESTRNRDSEIDASTIGTFRNLCVVIGGPGSGKSLLLEVLAREFAKDSFVSLRVRMRDLARRMEQNGCTVEEGIFELGLDGSGISPAQLHDASLSELVILCDGLDECGNRQSIIASGLRSIAESHPSYRVVVTTRPIGYGTSELRNWRHYEIRPLASTDLPEHLEVLCRCALGSDAANEDQLRDRIRTYLREADSSRTLARTPLLLAFGAALFLKWKNPCGSKSEIYTRIFKLIDDAPIPRKEIHAAPTKAIRDHVLNELGWQVVVSPLLASDEVERRCAQGLRVAMGVTELQARSHVQQSISYWEAAGLVERLSHADLELIAFVHKTCGEFAAARHLADMDPERARSVIRSELANSDSEEILDFATQTPLATTLAEILMAELEASEPDLDISNRLFRILARAETSLSPTERNSFLERVFALARSPDRRKAYRAGLCLACNDLSRLPEAEQLASRLLSASAEWSRLVGWAVLCNSFPGNLDGGVLEDAFHHFLRRSRDDDFFVRETHSLFGRRPDQGVFEEFLFGALKRLLTDADVHCQDRLMAIVGSIQHGITVGFALRLEALVEEMGLKGTKHQRSRWGPLFASTGFAFPPEYAQRTASLLRDVVSGAFLNGPSGPPPKTGLKFLSAFLHMSGMLEAPVTDIYILPCGGERLSDVHALFRAAASVFGLPAERLAAEAKRAGEIIDAQFGEVGSISALSIFPDVDALDPQWQRASDVDIDIDLLETMVRHRSGWLNRLAALMLNARLDDTQRARVCEHILSTAKGDSLYWGAALAIALPNHEGLELVLHRLEGPPMEGLHHLFDLLVKVQLTLGPAHLRVLENGLFESGAKTAVSAARWCQAVAQESDSWIVPVLVRAMEHWLEHEDPYPEGGGVVPDSPREALVRTLRNVSHLDLHQLAELSVDTRRDVSDCAVDFLIACAIESPDDRTELVDMIRAKQLPVGVCNKLLDMKVPYTAAELSKLGAMRKDSDAGYRTFVVRRVFTHPGMDPGEAVVAATLMKGDRNGNVRDAVYQFLESSEGSV